MFPQKGNRPEKRQTKKKQKHLLAGDTEHGGQAFRDFFVGICHVPPNGVRLTLHLHLRVEFRV